MSNTWKLSPSDLTFLWDECPRCFYMKVRGIRSRPYGPFPSIFTRIDGLMRSFFQGALAQEMASSLPQGIVDCEECWVTSQPASLPGRSGSFYIKGKFDSVVKFSDGTYGVIDFKTSQAKQEHVGFYGRQLHAYAYALEHPAPGSPHMAPVTRLGLLCVEPVQMERTPLGKVAYVVNSVWMEIPKDEQGFLGFVDEVVGLLDADAAPDPSPTCGYCQYRDWARSSGY